MSSRQYASGSKLLRTRECARSGMQPLPEEDRSVAGDERERRHDDARADPEPGVLALPDRVPGDVADRARKRDERGSPLCHLASRRKLLQCDYAAGRRAVTAVIRSLRGRERRWHTFRFHWPRGGD